MSRLKKERICRCLDNEICYSPINKKENNSVNLIEIDEFEVMRICDLEGKSQIEAAEIMNVSRGTIQRLIESGRKKLLEALLCGKCIKVVKKLDK